MRSYEDYAQALEFDELKVLMKKSTVLNGFNEGLINFPPTFKYDVLRTKRSKRRTPKSNGLDPTENPSARLTELEERDIEETEEDVEGVSLVSSIMTSLPTTEPGMQGDNSFHTLPATPLTVISSNKPSAMLNLATRAKARWLSTSFGTPSSKSPKRKPGDVRPRILSPPSPSIRTGLSSSNPNLHVMSDEGSRRRFFRPSPLNLVNPVGHHTGEEELETEGKGVYDSSHKKRVPSW